MEAYMRTLQPPILMTLMVLVCACGNSGTSYSVLPSDESFKQASSSFNDQIDLLWVVDNSASMDPLQQNMTANFNSFINQFVSKGYDFHLAVTTTDTYLSDPGFNNHPAGAQFVDGIGTTHTGVFDILPTTPNLINTFVTNASQGANGSGDERAFSSLRSALNSPLNSGFLRSTSFMGVIILSDEDDFSSVNRPEYSWLYRGGVPDHDYSYGQLDTVASYVSYLDTLTASAPASRRYSVSAITVMDNTCLQSHLPASPTSVIGQRYIDIASQTNGVVGSICDTSYASTLAAIQQQIVELSTQFPLSRTPIVSTIVVSVNGVTVPQDPANGWTYNATSNSILFHGTSVPPQGANISINFQPTGLSG